MNEIEELDQRIEHKPMQAKFRHHAILNALADMQASAAYAARKSVLAEAEITIAGMDVEIAGLRAALVALANSCDTGARGTKETTKAPALIELRAARAALAKAAP